MTTITVDSREPPLIKKLLKEIKEIDITVKKLPEFDYIIGDRIGVERKSYPDLVGSVASRRLYDQIRRMLKTKYKPYILLEGHISHAYNYTVYNKYFKQDAKDVALGANVSIAVSWNIPTLYAETPFDTITILQKLCKKHEVYRDKLPTPERTLRPTEKVLSIIEGIGPTTARRIVKKCGTNLSYYNKDKLLNVKGIGEKTATKVLKFLGECIVIR